MSSRQVFSDPEKWCLQELVIKYKLNSAATTYAGNPAAKKMTWARLVEEFNSIETNSQRTEAQLKKCWDNLKTRKKAALASAKKERMMTGGSPYDPKPGTSKEDPFLMDEALVDQTDVELQYAIDSDNLTLDASDGKFYDSSTIIEEQQNSTIEFLAEEERRESNSETITGRDNVPQHSGTCQRSGSRKRSGSNLTDYSTGGQQTPGAKNIRARVIADEFSLRRNNYQRAQEREEELHLLKVAEHKFFVKTAEVLYKKACIELENAEIILNKTKCKN